ncbi:hypothetical protein BH20ACI2_BH20ACI2_21820 [soil metagenome]
MFGPAKNLKSFIQPTSVLAGFLFTATLAILPMSVGAQCSTGWDASGQLAIFQRGQADPIMLTLEQKGRTLSGSALHKIPDNFGEIRNTGLVDGSIDGDSITFQIFWPPRGDLVGVYNAKILPTGRLDGETYDKNRPKIRQTWFSGGSLKCSPPPIAPPKPIKSSGKAKVKPATPQTSQPPPPPMKVPGIVASQAHFPMPNHPAGIVILQWDAGPEHPYAEVWVKVDGGEETFVLEKGKGGLQAAVVKGRAYTYLLMDAGKTLATVRVVP